MLLFFPIIVRKFLIYTSDNFLSELSQCFKNLFIKQARIVKKKKVETEFDKEDYI